MTVMSASFCIAYEKPEVLLGWKRPVQRRMTHLIYEALDRKLKPGVLSDWARITNPSYRKKDAAGNDVKDRDGKPVTVALDAKSDLDGVGEDSMTAENLCPFAKQTLATMSLSENDDGTTDPKIYGVDCNARGVHCDIVNGKHQTTYDYPVTQDNANYVIEVADVFDGVPFALRAQVFLRVSYEHDGAPGGGHAHGGAD